MSSYIFEMSLQLVQAKIDIGHRATRKPKPDVSGHTHDWILFVRGHEGCDIQHLVDKVIFNLHHTFPKPKRGEYRVVATKECTLMSDLPLPLPFLG